MTRMVVDWQVEAADGKKYDIIFVATGKNRVIVGYEYSGSMIVYKIDGSSCPCIRIPTDQVL